ncbi:hypothetical protein RhiirA4_426796 [Rhizophagus irregularis]|uniref:RNase H type-1 domain-containing protein n=1 Tax=Rhizophagus irregularis TaxID=588596 RepID=A0A2I1H6H7_9GLOM|nr:hypothetical protein RhiirA4_426796 [Rhizophagus irregularis]
MVNITLNGLFLGIVLLKLYLSVVCVLLIPKKSFAIISHWLPTSDSDFAFYHPYPGYSRHIPKYAALSHIKQHCTSELCFFHAPLANIIAYPTRNAKVFATGRPIILFSSLRYATALASSYFNHPLLISDDKPSLHVHNVDDEPTLSPSTMSIYIDRSFLATTLRSPSSMSYTWLALDNDNLVLESSSDVIPNTYPSALRSETVALLSAIRALAHNSSIIIYTDCASLISSWHNFIDKPFILKLLRQPNYLLWLSIRNLILDNNLSITLQKVPAHGDCPYNNQVDFLAKDSHLFSQPLVSPAAVLRAPYVISYNNLPIDAIFLNLFMIL